MYITLIAFFMADSILRLRVQSDEYNNKLKQAVNELLRMETECRKVNGTLGVLEKEQLEYVKSLGQMETASKTAQGRVRELSNAYLNFSLIYKRMSDREKTEDGGKALANSLKQLKERLDVAKKDLADVEKEMKGASAAGIDFNAVLQGLGSRFGINSDLMGALTSGTLATTAAVTAGAAAVAAATKMWADYNDELNRQTNVTTVTTGLKGDDAENLTIGVRALAKTYDVDFREAINAANTLIQQFGVSGEQALSLLQDGMQGMIAGDGGKLLSMIQQYAPSFRDAGISASQLVAIIQNSEGGIFTDQNMNAIVMGIRNIRLMTKQTSDALAQLGIDGQDMSRKLEDGSMTIFDALRQVSDAIDNVDSGSKAAGEVMQSVFGRQGTMAGTKLGEAIATLNTNLEETKKQTGELGESFVRLNEANMRLENTMKEVFGMTGWEDMSNEIKTGFLNTLSDALSDINDIKKALQDLSNVKSFDTLAHAINPLLTRLLEVTGALDFIKAKLVELGVLQKDVKPTPSAPAQNGYRVTTDSGGKVVRATRLVNGVETDDTENYKKTHPDKKTTQTITTPTTTSRTPTVSKKETWAPIAMQAIGGLSFGRSISDVQADLSRSQKTYNDAGDEIGRAAAKQMVERFQTELERMKNEGDVTKGGFADAYNYDFGKDIDKFGKQRDEMFSTESGSSLKDSLGNVNEKVQAISQVASGLQQMGVELPDGINDLIGVMQGAMQVVQGVQTFLEAGEVVALGANTTAIGLNTAAIVALTASMDINSATSLLPFAHGGVVRAAGGWTVPGRSYNDTIPSLLTSGEVVLNRAQQGNLLSQMESGGGRMSDAQPYVDGEKIWLGVNNYLKRSGRGEIVVSKK